MDKGFFKLSDKNADTLQPQQVHKQHQYMNR